MSHFITFEGVEGSGKSTQLSLLKVFLELRGTEVLTVREPGGTPVGERVRGVLLTSECGDFTDLTELFLYLACRSEVVAKLIAPALADKKTVLCDRYIDSTVAYQGSGRGIATDSIESVNALATGGLKPDLTLLFDIEPEEGLKRALKRIDSTQGAREDRFELEHLDFHRRVREGFLGLAEREPERIKVIDASREVELIHKEVREIVERLS